MEFARLSRYAQQLVGIAALRVERFIRGLADPSFTILASQIGKVIYVEAVNATLLIESSKIERKASKEAAKKPKTRRFFFCGFSSKGGYYPQS